ncbi:hypothetical protein VTO42DRAFT_8105 [Malbranchea cinnamomea]
MSDSVDRVFVHALNTVKKIPRTGTTRPPPAERLKLYGLYKQSMEGDVEDVMARPIGDGPDVQAEKEKWDAWYLQRGLSRTEAKRRYISTLIETMHRYAATTPEAEELISELEFVWDQIKFNAPSSSSSSPLQSVGMSGSRQPSRQPYGSVEGRLSGQIDSNLRRYAERNPSRLRVLSPVSQPEDDYRRRPYDSEAGEEGVEEEEEEEEFQEARDSLYEDDEQEEDEDAIQHRADGHRTGRDMNNRRWRRRVEQALTKMTAEIAAMREQMEAKSDYSRRRSSIWAWLKWLVWVAVRQVLWDLAMFMLLLIFLRLKGDRRLEYRLQDLWFRLRKRLPSALRTLRRLPRYLSLP